MKRTLLSSCTLLFSLIVFAQTTTINLGTTNVEAKNIFTSPEMPWELKYGPDDFLWMTTREGIVYHTNPETGATTLLLDHSAAVEQNGEAGMLGMVFHPAFPSTPYVYISYNYLNAGNIRERLSRFTYSGGTLVAEFILLDGGNIAGSSIHNGSRLLMLPDNTLLMSTGDANNTANPQNMSSLNGKILRLNLDGSVPADNPFPGSYVYTLGHRNPQGLMLHPNGKIYSTEHGPDSNDEFQIIEAGRNYGWPNVYGFCDNDLAGETTFCTANNVKEPLASWNPIPGGTWAPNDLIWYTNAAIPEFQNSFLVTFLKSNKVRRVQVNATGDAITGETDFFVNQWGRLRDITTSPTGDLFIATNTAPFRIIRIRNLSVVPVRISSFTASCNAFGKAVVKFTANNEANIARYLVYTAGEDGQYHEAATIPAQAGGAAVKDYAYTLPEKANYYKIVAEDISGKTTASDIIALKCSSGGSFAVYPNPADKNTSLNITGISEPVFVNVFCSTGSKIFSTKTMDNVQLPVADKPAGLYIVIVTDKNNQVVYKEKLIVR